MPHPDRSTLDLTALQQTLEGEVHSDALQCAMLATDGSIFSVQPAGVVYPRSTEDVRRTARFAARNNLSLHPRGAGSGLCGSALGRGLVVDFTKYMNRLVRLDAAARTFTCQPGYRFGELASLLKGEGLFFPPDPSSGEYATFGGMLATNASGAHSVKYGNTADYLEENERIKALPRYLKQFIVDQQYDIREQQYCARFPTLCDRIIEVVRVIEARVGAPIAGTSPPGRKVSAKPATGSSSAPRRRPVR